MKKKIFALLFSMLICLFSLTACVSTEQPVTDTSIEESLSSSATGMIEKITAMDDAKLDEMIEYYGIDGMKPDSGLLSGLTSWKNNREDLGAYVSTGDCTVVYDTSNKRYVAKAEVTFEKRTCEFKMLVNKQLDTINSIAFNPNFTFGEKMGRAGMNTVMGIATVFMMLILISLLIYCFKFIHAWEEKKNNAAKAAQASAANVEAALEESESEAAEEEEELSDDLELVAVISAAIAAYEGSESADGLVVRSIKRAKSGSWKRA